MGAWTWWSAEGGRGRPGPGASKRRRSAGGVRAIGLWCGDAWRWWGGRCAGRRRVEFEYRSPQQSDQAPRRHVVDPWARYFDTARGHYYLRGWCHWSEGPKGRRPQNRYYVYRLGRIAGLQLRPEKLPPFPPPARRFAVEYELSAQVARLGVSRQQGIEIAAVEARPDGSALVRGQCDDPFLAVQALLHYGPNCRVLGGPEVLERMRVTVRLMAEAYAGGGGTHNCGGGDVVE